MFALIGSTAASQVVSHMPTHTTKVANMAVKVAMSAAPLSMSNVMAQKSGFVGLQ
jgi:hypothetical protein